MLCAAKATECPYLTGALSTDGTRLAYVSSDADTSTIAILNIATKEVTRLESTKAPKAVTKCDSRIDAGFNAAPSWSPDGSRLAFERGYFGVLPGDINCRQSVVFVVNSDGTGLRQLTSADMVAFRPEWSPDGATIAFGGDERKPSALGWATDLYTISADGTDLRALTTSGAADVGGWTTDGRVVLRSPLGGSIGGQVRFFEPDGGGETQIDDNDVAALTAAGCTICPLWLGDAYWQPMP